jgi:V/A-type H+/Na+-transporting ATPase subunit E
MAIEDIFRALEEQADAECKTVLDNAKAQADAIMAEAREEAEAIRRRRREQVEATVKSRTMQMVNAAKLENRRKTAAVKEAAIEGVFDGAAAQLAKSRKDAGYARTFNALLEEALEGVTGHVEVRVDPGDRALAEPVLNAAGLSFELQDVPTSGGVVVVAGEGRIYRRNTFEDRLGKVRQRSQAMVSEILFS